MRNVITLARKDLRLLWRDKFGLFWVIAFPLLIAVFFGTIFSGGGDGGQSAITVAAVDLDSSEASRAFLEQMRESDALEVIELDIETARARVRRGKVTAFVVIGKGFGEGPPAFFGGESNVQIGIDPARQAEAAYLRGIITQLSFEQAQRLWTDREYAGHQLTQLLAEIDSSSGVSENDRGLLSSFFSSLDSLVQHADTNLMSQGLEGSGIEVESVSREPEEGMPRSAFEVTFPSAILWALLGCAATFGISIVKERNAGTYLRLRLAPLSRAHILAGKGMACFTSCLGVSLMLILLGRLVFGVRTDNPPLLAVALVSAAVCFVGIMMAMSVLGKTEDSVAGAGWAILLVMAMLGGGMMPLFFMPGWLRAASSISPVKWGILALEGAVWRDFTFAEMLLPVAILWGVGIAFFATGVFVFSRSEI